MAQWPSLQVNSCQDSSYVMIVHSRTNFPSPPVSLLAFPLKGVVFYVHIKLLDTHIYISVYVVIVGMAAGKTPNIPRIINLWYFWQQECISLSIKSLNFTEGQSSMTNCMLESKYC